MRHLLRPNRRSRVGSTPKWSLFVCHSSRRGGAHRAGAGGGRGKPPSPRTPRCCQIRSFLSIEVSKIVPRSEHRSIYFIFKFQFPILPLNWKMMAAHWHGFMRFCCLRSGGRARAAGTGAAVVATFGLQQGSRVGRWGLVGVFK